MLLQVQFKRSAFFEGQCAVWLVTLEGEEGKKVVKNDTNDLKTGFSASRASSAI